MMKLMTVPHALIQHQWCPNQNKTCKHYVNISLGTILHHDSESELSADNFFYSSYVCATVCFKM